MKYVADELVADILRRLPASSVVRFGCACKSWYNLIRNPNFISSHFQNSPSQQQHVVHNLSEHNSGIISLLLPDNGDCFQSQELQLPSPFYLRISGSCIHFGHGHFHFTLFNPSIRHSFWLPNPQYNIPFGDYFAGFGFDDDSKDYKILKFDSSSAEIYSFNSNCWRDIAVPEFSHVYNKVGAFVNGALHWVVRRDRENVVIVFDVKAETFQQFSLPLSFASCYHMGFRVFEFGGTSIAVTRMNFDQPIFETDIVVMKEYGVTESWVHLATVGKVSWGYYEVMGFRDKDQVFIRNSSRLLASYKFYQGSVNDLLTLSEVFSVHKYVPSLFLLDKENNAPAHT